MKSKKKKQKKKLSKRKKLAIWIGISSFIIITPILLFLLCTHLSLRQYPEQIGPSEELCLEGYFFLPNSYKVTTQIPGDIEVKNKTTIFKKYDIFAKTICIKPNTLLSEYDTYTLEMSYLENINWGIFKKKIQVTTEGYPEVKGLEFETEINYDQLLEYQIDYSADLLEYYILANDNNVPCKKENLSLLCDISHLNLEEGETYEINLVAKYREQILKKLDTQNLEILTSVKVTDSSIEEGDRLTDPSLDEILITLNKEVEEDFTIELTGNDDNKITLKQSLDGKEITINPQEDFKQDVTYTLTITDLKGLDTSHMKDEYTLTFSLDDGPTVTGTNISTGFSLSNNIVLTFDQSLNEYQNVKNYIKLNSGTDYSYSVSGRQITINPTNNLTACRTYSLNIYKGLVSNTGLVATNSRYFSIKTYCKRSTSIGTSVQGRGIYAYYFGTGSKKILFYGAMHGSEANTKYTLYSWITELENNIDDIPSDKTIIVVPALNPDGVANATRFNANGVDINRNFDTSTWVPGTYFLSTFYPDGGGEEPFSEPETRAIRNLIQNTNPYLTLSYHCAAGYVVPTNTSIGMSLGQRYSQLTGYTYTGPGADDSFTYSRTGTFGEWMENRGSNGLIVELSSPYYNEFSKNKSAMWEMVKY